MNKLYLLILLTFVLTLSSCTTNTIKQNELYVKSDFTITTETDSLTFDMNALINFRCSKSYSGRTNVLVVETIDPIERVVKTNFVDYETLELCETDRNIYVDLFKDTTYLYYHDNHFYPLQFLKTLEYSEETLTADYGGITSLTMTDDKTPEEVYNEIMTKIDSYVRTD